MAGKNVAIVTPLALNSVSVDFFQSFTQANQYLQMKLEELPFEVKQLRWIAPHTFPIDANRNECIAWLKKWEIDVSVWIDADQVLEMETIFRLLSRGHGYPIYAGMYHLKKPDYYPIVFLANDEFDVFQPVFQYPEEELFYADMIGMGCVKIDKEVIDSLERPYFKYQAIPDSLSTVGEIAKFKIDNEVHDVSEDVWFWKQVKEKTDYKIVVDPTIQVGHTTSISISKDNFIGYQNYKSELAIKQMGLEQYKQKFDALRKPELLNGKKNVRYVLNVPK